MVNNISLRTINGIISITLLGVIFFLPNFKSLDLKGPQFLYLSIYQLFVTLYLILDRKYVLKKVKISKTFLFLGTFIIIAFLSLLKTINLASSVIELSRHLIIFITLFNTFILMSLKKDFIKYTLILLVVLLSIESIYIFKIFLENYSFSEGLSRIKALQGFSSNQNVGAFSLCIKIPITIYFLINSKNKLSIFLLYSLLFVSVFDILVIGSRGAILGLYFISLGLLFSLIIKNSLGFSFVKQYKKKLGYSILIIILAFIAQNGLYQNKKELAAVKRSISYSKDDESFSKRTRYYSHALENMLRNPLLGSGIGIWKVLSIKYDKEDMWAYQVPLHTHNDFLQIGAETGILGFFSYLFFYLSILILLIKLFLKNKDDIGKSSLMFFLILSLIIYFFDANVNFPRARPYSQVNIIYILAICLCLISSFRFKKQKTPTILFLSLIFLIPLTPISYKLFTYMQEQAYVYYDFNDYRDNLQAPKEMAFNYEEDFPNLSSTTIPMAIVKANYYEQDGQIEKAISLNNKGNQYNPYIGVGEFQNARIYMNLKNYDSAYYYSKIAIEKLPNNIAHLTRHQKILAFQNDIVREKKLFYSKKHLKNKMIWSNHALLLTRFKQNEEFKFLKEDFDFVQEAVELFPEDKWIKAAYKIVNTGFDKSVEADLHDKKANSFYNKTQYIEAIGEWEKASRIIVNEDSYYLNIAKSYYNLGFYQKGLDELNKIEKNKIKSQNGNFEFLKASLLFEIGQKDLSCQYANKAESLGFKNSKKLKLIVCN
ncbi:MAG: hypothetical protein CMD29_02630 [Flavobacteriales bacterium]|jgi:O-antigen ligase|nr:hypothetical protein [Flavobacteriales bacterium]